VSKLTYAAAIVAAAVAAAGCSHDDTAAVSSGGSNAGRSHDDELTPVSIHGGFAPPHTARYAEKLESARARPSVEAWRGEIPEVLLRHQMLAAEYGRIKVDLQEQRAGDFFLALAHRWGFSISAFRPEDRFPKATLGPLKGSFTFDEALDFAFRDTDCVWYPGTPRYVTYECGHKSYAF
jgi:hypothetical protein